MGAGIALFLLFAIPLVLFRVRAYRRSKRKKDNESSANLGVVSHNHSVFYQSLELGP